MFKYAKGKGFSGTEDHRLDKIDQGDVFDMLVDRLDEELGKDLYPDTKTLKRAAAAVRLHQITMGYRAALCAHDLKQLEYWGGKIEEFCVSKPSGIPESVGKGIDMLMEIVAQQLGERRRQEITGGE